jgi:hypothetical protein
MQALETARGVNKRLLPDGDGLYLRVRNDGTKYWLIRLYKEKK